MVETGARSVLRNAAEVRRAIAEKQWRAEMKRLGRPAVRKRFTDRLPVTDSMPYPDSKFVQAWLDQQDRNAKFWPVVITAMIILLAVLAAWPTVKGWMAR
jgi:hypothetical protein